MGSSRGFAIASLSSGFRIALVTLRLQFAPAPCFAQPMWDGANIVQVRVGPRVFDADHALLIAFGDPRGNVAGLTKATRDRRLWRAVPVVLRATLGCTLLSIVLHSYRRNVMRNE
jgi:hypothetical protein